MPEPLRNIGGELIGQVWRAAYDQAQADLAQVRLEFQDEAAQARAEVAQARQTAGEAEAKAAELAAAMGNLRTRLSERDALIADRERELIQVRAVVGTLQSSLAAARTEAEQGRQAFTGDLEGLRAAIALTEERARGSERRALAEVEVSRRKADDAGKALIAERRRLEAETVRLGKIVAKRESEIDALRDRLARSESRVKRAPRVR